MACQFPNNPSLGDVHDIVSPVQVTEEVKQQVFGSLF